ncbi:MAG TPA: hypothetical protein VNX65_00040 [Patescibacteria group bacterium]|jgi:hypothetical protein|nr:hypothetical protein [Patescibacteria group bacterium]
MNTIKLRRHAIGLLAGYVLQFLAGMVLNLFVTIPETHPGSSGPEYFSRSFHSLIWALSGQGGWPLAFHAYLALALVLASAGLLINSILQRSKIWTIVGSVAALFTLTAFFNGMSFVDYNKNFSSMIMATCWMIAVGAVIYGLVVDRSRKSD